MGAKPKIYYIQAQVQHSFLYERAILAQGPII